MAEDYYALLGVEPDAAEAAIERETLENRLAAVDDRFRALDDIAADLEAVQDELDQLRRRHGDDVRDLEASAGRTRIDGPAPDRRSRRRGRDPRGRPPAMERGPRAPRLGP